MRELDLRGKHFMVFGKKNTGKSYFINWLMRNMRGSYGCFDPMDEHPDYTDDDLVVVPNHRRGEKAIEELELAVDTMIHNRDVIDAIFIDEVNRFHTKGGQLTGPLADLADYSAHYNMTVGMIARRPVQVHTDLRDLADYLFIFRLTGISDIRTLDDIATGLGERVASLGEHEFYVVEPSGEYYRHQAIQDNLNHQKGI